MLKGRLRKSVLLAAGVYEDYHKVTLSNYTGPRKPKQQVAAYVGNLDKVCQEGLSLLFTGNNNAGKTSLAMIIAKAFLITGRSAQVTSLRELTDLYASGWKSDDKKQEFDNRMRDSELLVIDDLLKELHNKATAAILDATLRHRSNRRMPFVITTNASMEELAAQYGPSFVALIQRRAVVVEFKGSLKQVDVLMDKNLELLNSLAGNEHGK